MGGLMRFLLPAWCGQTRFAAIPLAGVFSVLLTGSTSAQAKRHRLESVDNLRLHNVIAEPTTFKGKRGLRVAVAPEVARLQQYAAGQMQGELLAWIEDLEFSNGSIEAEIAGAPVPGAVGARGFVGIAFRLQIDDKTEGKMTYDAFYLRPTNGRAEDQERRNHATQYISHPDWTWSRLRRETPSRYESYVDLVPDEWTRIRIEVRGDRARLYVHDLQQPVLIVNDVKSGSNGTGAVALWIDPGTVAHFRNLVVTAEPTPAPEDDVSVGYGTQSKRHVTGAVTSISPTEADARVLRLVDVLEARVPGLEVIRLPGETYSIRIRGAPSIARDPTYDEPLLVIDDLLVPRGSVGATLAGLAVRDVARIDVLKDAASTSVYGFRGAGGVIIITTKRRP